MKRIRLARLVLASLSTLVVLTAAPAEAQVIGLRTVPLAAGDQFLFFPSETLGMGGASIAIDDLLADPFSNPAMGALAGESRVFSVPTFYSVSEENGGASTMPIGVHARGATWFGGVTVALQDLNQGEALRRWIPRLEPGDWTPLPRADALASRSSTNRFAHLAVGRDLSERWAVAASVMLADLHGTDGVEQLFADAWDIEEYGSVRDFRVGIVGRLGGDRRIDLTLGRNRVHLTQDVTSVTWELTDSLNWWFKPRVQEESHRNISKAWAARLGYVQPLDAEGWRAGASVTVNRKDHPKIPTYDLTAVRLPERPPIPRDPGNSWAFDIGAGLAYQEGPTTFALDVGYQPAVSDTWADELVDVTAADGSVIPAGGHTVDNHFDFSNAHASVGLSQEIRESWALQLGVRMRSYSYRMEQADHVLGLERDLTQQWTEWTPTWGLSHELNGVRLRYVGMASSAAHFPFPSFGSEGDEVWVTAEAATALDVDVLAPPSGRLGTPDVTVVTHRLQVSVPIR